MILDIRGLAFVDAFKEVRSAVSDFDTQHEDVIVFVDADEFEKCAIIKGFVEMIVECETIIEESGGYYFLKIIPLSQAAA